MLGKMYEIPLPWAAIALLGSLVAIIYVLMVLVDSSQNRPRA